MSHDDELDAATETAWRQFRGRLADHLAGMPHDDVLIVALSHASDRDARARTIEATLDEESLWLEVRADDSDAPALRALGWQEERGCWFDDYDPQLVDQAAVLVVRTLREVLGAPHPVFVVVPGLAVDPAPGEVLPPASHDDDHGDHDDELDLEGVPTSPRHLRLMVESAMADIRPEAEPDADGDLPVAVGGSVLFVRVLESRPCVELYAEIVLSPERLDRLAHELVLLNEAHPLWKFALRDAHVVMTHEMPALPFTALGLRLLVSRFVEDVDQVARDLVARVGGHLFAEPPPEEDERDVVLLGLLEMLHLDRVRPSTVAGLFADDRLEIIRQIVRIRRGRQSCGDVPEERVLTALRQALRYVSDGPQPMRSVPVSRRSVQEPLLEELPDQEALDLGWSA